jgi:BirA family biotin operon repressor/biotin-[acetyl-CoA-carboxylase] ligase
VTPDLPPGFGRLRLDTVASTNDVARDLAEAGREAGLVVTAQQQTNGRGRRGRGWASPPGNLYASLILRPGRPMVEVASLSLVTALALAEAIEALSGGRLRPRVKWPNDVLVDDAKLAGILLEGCADAAGGCRWLVVGTGVNVAWSPGIAAGYPTTDLAAHGLAVHPDRVLAGLLAVLATALPRWEASGFAPFRTAWLDRAAGLGRPIRLAVGEDAVEGVFLDLDARGAVRVRHASGAVASYAAGELVLA